MKRESNKRRSMSTAKAQTRSKFWRGVRFFVGGGLGPIPSLIPWVDIVRFGHLVRTLTRALTLSSSGQRALEFDHLGNIDLSSTAKHLGETVNELEVRLHIWQKKTAIQAYLFFCLGFCLFSYILVRAYALPNSPPMLIASVEYIPFVAIMFVFAFRSAYLNFQIRMRRHVSPKEYLDAYTGFWPR